MSVMLYVIIYGNFIRRHLFIPQGMKYELAVCVAPRAVQEGLRVQEARPSPEPAITVTTTAGGKRERKSTTPSRPPLVVVSRDPRRQALQRAQPGVRELPAVKSRDASSCDQQVRGIGAKSGAGTGASAARPASL